MKPLGPVPIHGIIRMRDFSAKPVIVPGITLVAERYSHHAIGGPLDADIRIYGNRAALDRLNGNMRCVVELWARSELVWWGYLHSLNKQYPGATEGVNLETMYNAVEVAYTTPGTPANPSGEQRVSDAAINQLSIDTFGRRERLISLGEMSEPGALARRDRTLNERKFPLAIVEPADPTQQQGATPYCKGLFDALSWTRFSRNEGIIGQTEDEDSDDLWYGALGQLPYVSTAIRFADDQYHDAINETSGLGWSFVARQLIVTSGAALTDNNSDTTTSGGVWPVESARNNQIIVLDDRPLNTYDFDNEDPGASVTIAAYGQRLAQVFQHAWPGNLYQSKVKLKVMKVGAPVDDVQVSLQAVDIDGHPDGTEIEVSTVDGDDIDDSMAVTEFEFTNVNQIAANTLFSFVVERTGVADHENYFLVEINATAPYTGGGALVEHDWGAGLAWEDWALPHAPGGDLWFVVELAEQTTEQIARIVTDEGQFLTGTFAEDLSAVYSCPHRTGHEDSTGAYVGGENTAKEEIEKLLRMGHDTGTELIRMIAEVNPQRVLRVRREPAQSEGVYLYYRDGRLHDPYDNPVPAYRCPVAFWVRMKDVLTASGTTPMAGGGAVFVERSEYDARNGRLRLYPRGLMNPWEVGGFDDEA